MTAPKIENVKVYKFHFDTSFEPTKPTEYVTKKDYDALKAELEKANQKLVLREGALHFSMGILIADIKNCLNPNLTNQEQIERIKDKLSNYKETMDKTDNFVDLKSKNDLLMKCVEFYADRKNWTDRSYESPDGNSDNDGDIFDVIEIEDVEIATDDKHNDESYIGHYTFGGKRARAALAKIGVL